MLNYIVKCKEVYRNKLWKIFPRSSPAFGGNYLNVLTAHLSHFATVKI